MRALQLSRFVPCIVGIAATALVGVAFAGESPIYGGPIGGTDIGAAYLPPEPGLYMGAGYIGLTSDRFQDVNGNKVPFDTGFDASAGVVGLNYVYDSKVFGGSIASSAQVAYGRRCIRFGERNCSSGIADIYSDVFFWSKYLGGGESGNPTLAPLPYGLTIGAGLGVTMPTGRYDQDQPVNTGGNTWILSPNLAATYLTGPKYSLGGDGTEFSARLYYSEPLRNRDTNFDAGTVVNLDWAITERYGNWQVGIAGQQAKQIESDKLPDGTRTNETKFSSGSVGPVVSVFVPSIGSQIKVKAAANYDAENTFSGYSLVMVMGWKVF
ncbi:transporter [Pseudomonas seleniipraecipitans]|uniref:Transporter n=1 Tax=Phytopseudomonas seleniipraecipitans TaxID=640205 RepID=A0ABY5J4W6_9GAMM|nr:transporter [Pseudomonas seleniipraecipitans]UUD63108.1 transporter [Pseudomonas seleniipraecipitans]